MEEALETGELCMVTMKDKTGKFGRYLANFHRGPFQLNHTLKKHLIAEHLAVEYHGQAKSEVAAAHAANIEWLKEAGKI